MTLRIGLTGGIGAGKTTVAKIFESFGVPLFYADIVAKRLIAEDTSIKQQIISAFGKDSYLDNKYNSSYIAAKVFNNFKLLKVLNNIVHPFVLKDFLEWYSAHLDSAYVIEEAALLLESGSRNYFDHIIVVTSPIELRLQRITNRDNIPVEEIRKRMNAQLKEEEMIEQADSIILNGVNDLLIPQVLGLHNKFVSLQI